MACWWKELGLRMSQSLRKTELDSQFFRWESVFEKKKFVKDMDLELL